MRIGIDLGGTKIAAIAMTEAGVELQRLRQATPQDDYAGVLACIRSLVASLERDHGRADRIGIGTPGSPSPATGLIRNSNSLVLNGKPLQKDLEAALGRSLKLTNDANCFALSEARDGAAADAACVFGVIVGTGTGAGIVVRGELQQGVNRIGGEWGHNPLPWPRDDERPGPACYCGRQGCIETWLSGPGLSAAHQRDTGAWLTARDIATAAAAGEAAEGRSLAQYAERMARSLASVINVLDPDVIVLGGGLGQIEALYRLVPACWGQYVFSDTVRTRLVPPSHGDDSGLRGAALL